MVAPKGCRIKSQKGIIVFRCDRIASHRAGYLVACAEECSRHLAPDAKASYRIAPYSLAVQGAPRVYPMFSSIFSPTVPGRPEGQKITKQIRWFSGHSGVPGTVGKMGRGKGLGRACRISWVHCHRKTERREQVAHLRGVRLECKAIWGLVVQTPLRISFRLKPLARPVFTAHRPPLCPRRLKAP